MGHETLNKIQTIVYLSEKTRYFAGLATKHMGVTLSEFVADLMEVALETMTVSAGGHDFTYEELHKLLWVDHPADRLALLAGRFPGEMTIRESLLWRNVICQLPEFWLVPLTGVRIAVSKDTFNFELLRERWEEFDSLNRPQLAALAKDIKSKIDIEARRSAMNAAIFRDSEAARQKAGN